MKKRKKLWIAIGAILLLLIVGIILYVLFFKPDDTPVIDPQYNGLSGYNKVEYDMSEDTDGDGLTNEEEQKYGTNILLPDTDGDGLLDGDEINKLHTDPLKNDTDSDGLIDSVEIIAGLDPNKKMTDGSVADSDVKFTTSYRVEEALLEVKGDANVYSVGIEKTEITGLRNIPGIYSDVFELSSDYPFDEAILTIGIKPMLLTELNNTNLTICQVKDDLSFEPVRSEIDTATWTITASLSHFSKYCVVNMNVINVKAIPQVMFVVDNSGSMYPKELCEDSNENDVNFKRVSMVENMVKKHYGEMEFGISKFTGNYTLMAPMGSSKDDLMSALNNIRTQEEIFNGTALETSLINALRIYTDNDPKYRKFIVLLTDGDSTEGQGGLISLLKVFDEDDIIERAKKQNVTIITIGLGNQMNKEVLQKIASNTEGQFINASNSDALDRIYDALHSALNYNIADLDNDGNSESVLLGGSNFDSVKNGFKYKNYMIKDSQGSELDGVCYGISSLEALYYSGNLPVVLGKGDKVNAGLKNITQKYQAEGYDLTDTFFADSEGNLTNNNLGDYTNSFLELYNTIYNIDSVERYIKKDGVLQFNDELRKMIEECPVLKIEMVEQSGNYAGGKYTSFEKCIVNFQGVNENELSEDERKDYEVLKAIYHLQLDQKIINSNRETIKLSSKSFIDSTREEGMDRVIELLQSGTPVILNGPGHAVLGTAIYRDLNDADKYTMIIVDPNCPGEDKEIIINRADFFTVSSTADYNANHYFIGNDINNIFSSNGEDINLVIINEQKTYKEQ